MEVKQRYANFLLTRKEDVAELNGTAYVFTHEKSGARLLYLETDDTNKVFSISFRTPPHDSTGVAHILEHSVLCGSLKFPLKEPFVELVKGSMNTFLNAMTYPDKTMYPVASKNDKDFHNLMDVYLDAVFYPRVATDSEIVMQEGWHYELEDKEAPLTYKGVVYNEMKGVFSSADSILDRHLMEVLFPESPYGVESGGDPDFITALTYEAFVDFYKKYYHPSNSYIFLYGKMDIMEQLTFIDAEYLSNFDAITVDSEIVLQKPFTEGKVASFPYGIASEESEQDKSFHALTYVLPELSTEESLALDILTHALLTSPAAPLKEALVKAGVGSDVSGYFLDSLRQPLWHIAVNGSNMEQQSAIKEVFLQTLQKMVAEGLDTTMLEASLNSTEFSLREADFGGRPVGLIYNIRLMDQWLYDRDPIALLRYEEPLRRIREGLTQGYFETLIEKYILQNEHHALVSIYPQKGLLEAKEEAEKERLASIKAQMSDAELANIVEQTKALKLRQETPDTEEALSTIPLLELADLEATVEPVERRAEQVGKATFHYVPTFANGIVYTDWYFDLSVLTEEELFYAEILSDILGRVATQNYGYAALSNEVNLHLGGFTTSVTAYTEEDTGSLRPFFAVRVKALRQKLGEIVRLVDEVLLRSHFEDKARLLELIRELKAVWDTEAFRRGHTLAMTRVLAQVSEGAKFQDQGELGYYQKLAALLQDEAALEKLGQNLAAVQAKLFRVPQLEVAIVGEEEDYRSFKKLAEPVLAQWPQEAQQTGVLALTAAYANEGIVTAGKVQYVAKGGNFKKHGFAYTGSMNVLETILRYEYLWTKVRVQGGAYGAFATFASNGNLVFCSYRDPNLTETVNVYDDMATYLENFAISEREMRKYIIGTMSRLDMPMTPSLRAVRAMSYYFRHYSEKEATELRKSVIACTPADIAALHAVVKAVMKDNRVVVMGNEQKIRAASELFTKIISLPN